jgi:hypothetical protein
MVTKQQEAGGPPLGDSNPNEPPDFGSTAGPEAKKTWFEKTFTLMVRDYDPSGHDAIHAANCRNVLTWAQAAGLWAVSEAEFVGDEVGDKLVTLKYRVRVVPAGSVDNELAVTAGSVDSTPVPILP